MTRSSPRTVLRGPMLSLSSAGFPPMEATAVVFDLDGVLVDSERAWLEVERQAVRELGGVWEPRQDDELAGSAPTVANEALAARCGLQGREDELGAVILRRAPDVFAHQVLPIPGALETVRAVADLVPVAIATNACRVIAEVSMATTGLDRLVPTVVSVSDVRVGKPAPDVYLAAAAGIGIDPATCLAVDDTRTGLLAAVAAGMRTIAFGHPTRIPDGVMGGVPNWAETRIGRAG